MTKLKAGPAYVLFKIDRIRDSKLGKGYDGKDIVLNERYYDEGSFEDYTYRNFGEVVSVPEKLIGYWGENGKKIIISEKDTGKPLPTWYHERSDESSRRRVANYIYLDAIVDEVEVGDRIYFTEDTLSNQNLKRMYVDEDGEEIYAVMYQHILCAVKHKPILIDGVKAKGKVRQVPNGVVVDEDDRQFKQHMTMIGSWTLVKPKIDDDIYLPTRNADGTLKPKSLWIQTSPEEKEVYHYGTVAHVGKTLKGQEKEVSVGDDVIYRKYSDYEVEIEGEKYYAMWQKDIVAIIE